MTALSWLDCATRLRAGDRVVFTEDWDIFLIVLVKKGDTGTVMRQDLNEIDMLLEVRPDDAETFRRLEEWDGNILLTPNAMGVDWLAPSPIELLS